MKLFKVPVLFLFWMVFYDFFFALMLSIIMQILLVELDNETSSVDISWNEVFGD